MGKTGTSVYHSSCLLIEQAHRSVQENPPSTYLMYGTDPRLSMEAALCPPPSFPLLIEADERMMFEPVLQPLKKDSVSLCLCLQPSQAKHTSWQGLSMVPAVWLMWLRMA